MPVVPFAPQPPKGRAPREVPVDQEPWVLMAAAQMDGEGRLIEPTNQQRTKGKALLSNAMHQAIDPTEGDYFRSDMNNTQRAAANIRPNEKAAE